MGALFVLSLGAALVLPPSDSHLAVCSVVAVLPSWPFSLGLSVLSHFSVILSISLSLLLMTLSGVFFCFRFEGGFLFGALGSLC